MSKFRKKPVVIEAVQWVGLNTNEVNGFAAPWRVKVDQESRKLRVETLEGHIWATEGDWIIKGVAGEVYPCKPDIFEATYEPVQP